MLNFDLSKNWTVYAALPAREPALELAVYCGLLREKAGLTQGQPRIMDAEKFLPDASPCIFLKASEGSYDLNGFTWSIEKNRIEISGDSARGLWNGVFDFLAAAGLRWPGPGKEELPQADGSGAVRMKINSANTPSLSSAQERKRFFIDWKKTAVERTAIVRWAARNKYDALVFSLRERFPDVGKRVAEYGKQIKRYAVIVEAGGCDLSLLLPRRMFLFHRDLFRMELGKRKQEHHFCPTNPKTTSRVRLQAHYLFNRAMAGMTVPRVFHLHPDEGRENTWCACPACRAFSPAEQNIIAVNSAADALADVDPDALLSFLDFNREPDAEGIAPRKNMFRLFTGTSFSPPGQQNQT